MRERFDPNVDRALAECWMISDKIVEVIRDEVAQLHAQVAEWEPAPCPEELSVCYQEKL